MNDDEAVEVLGSCVAQSDDPSRADRALDHVKERLVSPRARSSADVEYEQRVRRALAWLVRNEDVSPDAIERAVISARDMVIGESMTLDGVDAPMRRAFINEQCRLLEETR